MLFRKTGDALIHTQLMTGARHAGDHPRYGPEENVGVARADTVHFASLERAQQFGRAGTVLIGNKMLVVLRRQRQKAVPTLPISRSR
jgi:hypothetical protein